MNLLNFDDVKKELSIAKNNVKLLNKSLSEIDKLKNELEHQIENDKKVNACQGYKYFKAQKDIYEKRRAIKENLSEQQTIVQKLQPFVSSYESNQEKLEQSRIGGQKKYVRNLDNIYNKLHRIKVLQGVVNCLR